MRVRPCLALAAIARRVYADLSPDLLELVRANGLAIAQHSWELGTHAQAELEYAYPTLSVFGSNPFGRSALAARPQTVLDIVRPIIAARQPGQPLIDGDGSSGDPASLAPAALLTSVFDVSNASVYQTAVDEQYDILVYDTPRGDQGVISARTDEVSLWSDWVYMAPPAIAYLGAFDNNATQLQEAYNQTILYYNALKGTSGMVKHILGQRFSDKGYWATGNAWTAAGMVRVLATIDASSFKSSMSSARSTLSSRAVTILRSGFKYKGATNGLLDYFQNKTPAWFADPAASALYVATAYRLAIMGYSTTNIAAAEQTRLFVESQVDADGWVVGAVDPFHWRNQLPAGSHSPEAQSFVLMMAAAYRDWRAAGCPGGTCSPAASGSATISSTVSQSGSSVPISTTKAASSSTTKKASSTTSKKPASSSTTKKTPTTTKKSSSSTARSTSTQKPTSQQSSAQPSSTSTVPTQSKMRGPPPVPTPRAAMHRRGLHHAGGLGGTIF